MNLRQVVRDAVQKVIDNEEDRYVAVEQAVLVRAALNERGLDSDCHVGSSQPFLQEGEHILEWYAGQFLTIVDTKAWYSMNYFISCLDQHCPKE